MHYIYSFAAAASAYAAMCVCLCVALRFAVIVIIDFPFRNFAHLALICVSLLFFLISFNAFSCITFIVNAIAVAVADATV